MKERKQYTKREIKKKRKHKKDIYDCRTCKKEIYPAIHEGNLNWCCNTARRQLNKVLEDGN